MESSAAEPSSASMVPVEDLTEIGMVNLMSKIILLRREIEAGRVAQIKEKLNVCGEKLQSHVHQLLSATANLSENNNLSEATPLGAENALCVLDGFSPGSADNDFTPIHEPVFSKSTELPQVQRIPPYTTWIYLDRNQRMRKNPSVAGRRRIYYDRSRNETLICSDSEDDVTELGEEKRKFSEGEDRILWLAFEKRGLVKGAVDVVQQFIGGTTSEIMERYKELKLKFEASCPQNSTKMDALLEKSLSAALDSFDNLFCRRCLIFCCRLHGCSQNLIYPSEKPSSGAEPVVRKPCSDQCYLLLGQNTDILEERVGTLNSSLHPMEGRLLGGESTDCRIITYKDYGGSDNAGNLYNLGSNIKEDSLAEVLSAAPILHTASPVIEGKRKAFDATGEGSNGTVSFKDPFDKKQKSILGAEGTTCAEEIVSAKVIPTMKAKLLNSETLKEINSQIIDKRPKRHTARSSHNFGCQGFSTSPIGDILQDKACGRREGSEQATVNSKERKILASSSGWKPLEKDLYAKGLEIFGRNSCLIARNLLSGLKTCVEVFNYMHKNEALLAHKKDTAYGSEDHSRADSDFMEQETQLGPRSRMVRKKGRTRRLKYPSKSNGHPSIWKRVSDADERLKHYTPCTCQDMCGKDCSCLKSGNCCEKYCGCSKGCKNRFRGCQCAKGQCRSRQCPCFAADRECDPDVCRNCWVSCGGGSLGEPVKQGDGQCGNMNLLLRQRQGILLGRSDVAGWGAFLKNSVNKNEFLGEYTGELISNKEADKRGKIYDRLGSSYLFDLKNQYVLDAYRQGNELKFANHSINPNCYCKVKLVSGDHRVGIFSKERIEAGEEIFYDYCYQPEQSPAWAQRPEKDESPASQGRARKHQSR